MLRNAGRLAVGAALSALALVGAAVPGQAVPRHGWQIADQLPKGNPGWGVVSLVSTGPRDVWALGGKPGVVNHKYIGVPLARHFDGTKWRDVSLPGQQWGYFFLAAAVSSHDVWAFGTHSAQHRTDFAAHYDGRSWTWVPVGNALGLVQALALGPRDTWLLQPFTGTDGRVLRRTATSWRQYKIPGINLNAIDGVKANDVWGVGRASSVDQPSIVHWDGKSWKHVPVPQVGPAGNSASFNSVAAVSPQDVWAVGYRYDPGPNTPLVMHWDGKSWNLASAPALPDGPLAHAVRDGSGGVWAFQQHGGGAPFDTLVRYSHGEWAQVQLPALPGPVFDMNDLANVPGTTTSWASTTYYGAQGMDCVLLRYTL